MRVIYLGHVVSFQCSLQCSSQFLLIVYMEGVGEDGGLGLPTLDML